jgi:hypothetical protein
MSPVHSVPLAQATNRPKYTSPLSISLALPFVSCHRFSSRSFSFATQCRVQSQFRPDPLSTLGFCADPGGCVSVSTILFLPLCGV